MCVCVRGWLMGVGFEGACMKGCCTTVLSTCCRTARPLGRTGRTYAVSPVPGAARCPAPRPLSLPLGLVWFSLGWYLRPHPLVLSHRPVPHAASHKPHPHLAPPPYGHDHMNETAGYYLRARLAFRDCVGFLTMGLFRWARAHNPAPAAPTRLPTWHGSHRKKCVLKARRYSSTEVGLGILVCGREAGGGAVLTIPSKKLETQRSKRGVAKMGTEK